MANLPSFVLVDCNNFYASCERIFNPGLEHKPIVVLSNNDGCIIARSNEAKILGIPMGAAFYQYRALLKKHQVRVFSSNYTLYGDISQRVMSTLRSICPELEIYSIDEAFLQPDTFTHADLNSYAMDIRQKIKQWTGIPVSIGIAPTKTLAKIANYIAKRQTTDGIFDLRETQLQETILKSFDIKNIWGIGKRLSLKLNHLGIYSALELRNYPPKIIRQHFGVVVERTVLELNGISCLSLETIKPKKNIIASRSFPRLITNYEDLAAAISYHTTRASEKLRQQKSIAQGICVFINTNRFRQDNKQYHNSLILSLGEPTADTIRLIQAAKRALKQIFCPDYPYHKAGIMLMDIIPEHYQQYDLFPTNTTAFNIKRQELMQVMDNLNAQMGKQSLYFAAQTTGFNWKMRNEYKSPQYTTNWQELAQVKA